MSLNKIKSSKIPKSKTTKKTKNKVHRKKASSYLKEKNTVKMLNRKKNKLNKDGKTKERIMRMKIRCFPKKWRK